MNNTKKLFSLTGLFAIMLLVLPCLLFSGCGTTPDNEITIQNGAYRISSFLVDNVEDDSFIGTYYTLNNGVMTSLEQEGEITYTSTGENVTFTFPDEVVFTGTYNNTTGTITLSNTTDGHSTVVTLVYTANITVQNGTYQVTSFLVDDVSRDENVGIYYTLNNGVMTSTAEEGEVTYQIVGASVVFTFPGDAIFIGTYDNGTLTLTHSADGHTTVVTMVYQPS